MTTATRRPPGATAFAPSPELYPFRSRWLDSSAGPVHYVDEGEGRPLRDVAFPAKSVLPRICAAFSDLEVVELAEAKHFFLEDAPGEVVAAIAQRFGAPR